MSATQLFMQNALVKGYFAAKDYLTGAVTGAKAGAKFAYEMVRDTGISLAKSVIKGIANTYFPAATAATEIVTEIAAQGAMGLAEGNNLGVCLLKGGACAAVGLMASPIAAVPLSLAAGAVIDNAPGLYNGLYTAYNNAKHNNEYAAIKYRKVLGGKMNSEVINKSVLGESFVLMSVM